MTSRILFLTIFTSVFLNICSPLSQYAISINNSSDFLQQDLDMLTPGDSCTVLHPERHDGFVHADGYSQTGDSLRFVILFHPQLYPWTYTKVCLGLTRVGAGASTLNYNIVMYDSSTSGYPGNLLYCSPIQTATGIPSFPLMMWYSTIPDQVIINSGSVYLGVRFHNQPALGVYVSVDISAGTPLWPGYFATLAGNPPNWQTFINVPSFASYKCIALRTEGQQVIGIQNISGSVPQNYFLNQNYPNPFNPSTEFTFGVSRSGNVKLTVYDMLGRLVSIIADEYRSAGTYSAKFDASALSTGVYMYKLESGDFAETKKMLLVK